MTTHASNLYSLCNGYKPKVHNISKLNPIQITSWVQIVIFPTNVWCQILMVIIGQNLVPGCLCLKIL